MSSSIQGRNEFVNVKDRLGIAGHAARVDNRRHSLPPQDLTSSGGDGGVDHLTHDRNEIVEGRVVGVCFHIRLVPRPAAPRYRPDARRFCHKLVTVRGIHVDDIGTPVARQGRFSRCVGFM